MRSKIRALSDIVFKYIFGSPTCAEILRQFINAVRKDKGFPELTSLTIMNPINEKTFYDEKSSIIDTRARRMKF